MLLLFFNFWIIVYHFSLNIVILFHFYSKSTVNYISPSDFFGMFTVVSYQSDSKHAYFSHSLLNAYYKNYMLTVTNTQIQLSNFNK